eukprot:3822767-Lingulodinium_polyedra.AAC.1
MSELKQEHSRAKAASLLHGLLQHVFKSSVLEWQIADNMDSSDCWPVQVGGVKVTVHNAMVMLQPLLQNSPIVMVEIKRC